MPPLSRPISPPTTSADDARRRAPACCRAPPPARPVGGDAADDGARSTMPWHPIEDPALPDVVAAGARHRRDQARVGDGQERHGDRRQHDRQDRRRARDIGEDRQAVEHAQRDQVDRHERVGERVEARPALDEAGRVPQEQRRRSPRNRSHVPCLSSPLRCRQPWAPPSAVDQQIALHLALLRIEIDDRRLEDAVLVGAPGVDRQGSHRA